jgi:hypothetical protein
MLLVIFLGLITNIMLFFDGSHVGASDVTNVDWNKVDTVRITRFLNRQFLIMLLGFIFNLWFQ